MSAFFITATGTGIGKTFLTAALIHQLKARQERVAALKPVVTGFDDGAAAGSDPAVLLEALGEDVSPRTIGAIAPFRYAAPLAPLMAARRENRELDFAALTDFCRREAAKGATLLIEGVGGVMVPLTPGRTVLDWIAVLECPAILVAGSYLGTLSHTLTALEALKRRGIPLAGVVINESEGSQVPFYDMAAATGEFCAAPVVVVPRLAGSRPWARAPNLTGLLASN